VDVESWANLVIGFADGSRGNILVSDVGLGGLNTRVTAFMTDCVIKANMTSNDAIETYAPDAATFSGEYFTEKLETKAGWNRPSCDEDWFRGFAEELEDFVSAIRENREPRSSVDLAVECVKVIYAAYLSAETGKPGDHGLRLLACTIWFARALAIQASLAIHLTSIVAVRSPVICSSKAGDGGGLLGWKGLNGESNRREARLLPSIRETAEGEGRRREGFEYNAKQILRALCPRMGGAGELAQDLPTDAKTTSSLFTAWNRTNP